MIRAMGLDISLTSSGLTVLDGRLKLLDWRNPKTTAALELEERIDIISTEVLDMWKTWKPDIVVMESGARGGKVVDLNIYHLAGVVRWRLWRRQALIIMKAPNTLKAFAGNGKWKKPEMVAHVRSAWWPECPNDDLADSYTASRLGVVQFDELVQGA